MSRYIDADEIRWVDHYDSDGNLSKYKVAFSDEMPPTVDAVPVIRCKDCRWYKTNYSWDGKEHRVCVIEAYEPVRKADDFCSRAERKEE